MLWMDQVNDKYFVTKDNFGFAVIYQEYSTEAGNFWATEKDGFVTEIEAKEYADNLNKQ